jgi:hypothetical protein
VVRLPALLSGAVGPGALQIDGRGTATKLKPPMELRPPAPTLEQLAPAVDALEDAHHHWHAAADAYHEPADFRRNVESLIQALRNVTFRLQAEKDALPQFEVWYPTWQEFMRADEQLRWLIDARNDIVKHTGLRADSYALVTRITSYLEPDHTLLRLPVGTSTSEVVVKARMALPEEYRQHMAVCLTRRWAVPGRGQDEIMGLATHCWHILDSLLLYTREVAAGLDPEPPTEFVDTVQIPPCMEVSPTYLPRFFEADTGEEFHYATFVQHREPAKMAKAAKRYGPTVTPDELNHEPIERARQLHRVARTVYKRDGHHIPMLHLRRPDGEWELSSPLTEDKRDKFMLWHMTGVKVAAQGHDAYIFTSEVWTGPLPLTPTPYPDLASQPEKGEALVTWVETSDGRGEQITSPIFRALGKPFLKRSVTAGVSGANEGFSAPIHRAWQERATAEASRASNLG